MTLIGSIDTARLGVTKRGTWLLDAAQMKAGQPAVSLALTSSPRFCERSETREMRDAGERP